MMYEGIYPTSGKPSKAEIKKYEAEQAKREAEQRARSDLDTMINAEKIKADPDRFKAAMAYRKAAMDELDKIKA